MNAHLNECSRLEEAATYTAETHHILANRQQLWYKILQLVPAVASAVVVTLVVGKVVPSWVGIPALIAAIVTAIGTVMNPQQSYFEHLSAAKAFTVIKNDARAICELAAAVPAAETAADTKSLHERYNDLVRVTPPTEDWAFDKARKRIHSGVHKPDEKK
jgi:hypothetical protein